MEIPIFYGVIGENPKEWTNQVEKYLSKIGIKDDRRIFKIAKTHLLGNAEESEESLRNKIETLCKEYFRKGMGYLNEYEERCEHKNMNILRMGECKIAAYRNNQKIYEQTEYRN
ncbi:hypothetical protein RIR_jg18402.t1 [Rhizophagus irregularis DAOM 181602=DAOM 197198]|nr:hypothetical protein RIR_jg18402.t1 [Rhizophagus irregularis DAOM 181602=DAOM 197198]